LEAARRLLRKNRIWTSLRSAQAEGFLKAFQRYRIWTAILRTDPIETESLSKTQPVEIHLLCYWRDHLTAIWALKTFFWQAGVRYPVIIHTNAQMPPRAIGRLRRHFPNAKIIQQTESDTYVNAYLKNHGLTRLLKARSSNGFMLKLTDFILIGESRSILALDSDLLFFAEPAELRGGDQGKMDQHWFQEDPSSNYNISKEAARQRFEIDLKPRLNSGIMLFERNHAALEAYEQYLADPDVARSTGWIEQTLFAMYASAKGNAATWPSTYQLSFGPGLTEGVVVRHYAGPTRPLLTWEGMSTLLRRGLPSAPLTARASSRKPPSSA
jgi:hypothetical protein